MNKTFSFTLLGNTFEVSFPTTRQYIAIQNLKISIASNYDVLKFGGPEAIYAETLVDASAHLSVLCPQFIETLQNKNILDLDMSQSREVVKIYTDEIRPWYSSCLDAIFNVDKEKKDEKK